MIEILLTVPIPNPSYRTVVFCARESIKTRKNQKSDYKFIAVSELGVPQAVGITKTHFQNILGTVRVNDQFSFLLYTQNGTNGLISQKQYYMKKVTLF